MKKTLKQLQTEEFLVAWLQWNCACQGVWPNLQMAKLLCRHQFSAQITPWPPEGLRIAFLLTFFQILTFFHTDPVFCRKPCQRPPWMEEYRGDSARGTSQSFLTHNTRSVYYLSLTLKVVDSLPKSLFPFQQFRFHFLGICDVAIPALQLSIESSRKKRIDKA